MSIGLILIFALGSIGVYGAIVGGWASQSKYSLLGSMRTCAQLVSYEVSLALSVLGVVLMGQSLNLVDIVNKQGATIWFVVPQLAGLLVFFFAMIAETSRPPFDLPEADTELVAGYHTEYGGMRWGLFQTAEYINLITLSGLAVTLFFGGWHGPYAPLGPLWFLLKVFVFVSVFIWIRASVPRLRYDQLMRFGWKVLLPVATDQRRHHAPCWWCGSHESPAARQRQGLRASRSGSSSRSRSRSSTRSTSGPVYPRFRGRHRLHLHENGLEKCVGCSLCAAACPADCIRVVAEENTPENRVSPGERYARIYEINMSRCIFCGYCELACPFDAITLGNEYEISEYSRDDLIYTKDMLLARADQEDPGRRPRALRHADPVLQGPLVIVASVGNVLVWAVWIVAAFACLGSAVAVVSFSNPFYSALALIGNLGSLAVLYLLLSSEFVAAAQVLVYAGAVMVMFLFVIAYVGPRTESPWTGGPSWQAIGSRAGGGRAPGGDRRRDRPQGGRRSRALPRRRRRRSAARATSAASS